MPETSKNGACAFACAFSQKKTPPFVRVLDGRKQPIRNLWQRGDKFYARLNVTLPSGAKVQKRITLTAATVHAAKDELATLRQQRNANTLPLVQASPLFTEFAETYVTAHRNLKRPGTLDCEQVHLNHWGGFFEGVRLHKISKAAILAFRAKKLAEGWTGRSANLSLTVLRNVLNHAVDNGLILKSPADGIRPVKWVPKKRSLVTHAEIESLCAAAIEHLQNGQQVADYVRVMARCGSRRNETLRLKWSDVDWERKQLTIGADGMTKNHKARVVDFNPGLESHLRDMHSRKRGDCEFLFPTVRGDTSGPFKTFIESVRIARKHAGLPHFGFHDARHHFISMAVMSGIDSMTIASWVGHQDGGVLIGKVYGHLADAHKKHQAQRLTFAPAVAETPAQVA